MARNLPQFSEIIVTNIIRYFADHPLHCTTKAINYGLTLNLFERRAKSKCFGRFSKATWYQVLRDSQN